MFPLGSICKNDVKKIAADAGMDQFANKVEVRLEIQLSTNKKIIFRAWGFVLSAKRIILNHF